MNKTLRDPQTNDTSNTFKHSVSLLRVGGVLVVSGTGVLMTDSVRYNGTLGIRSLHIIRVTQALSVSLKSH